MSDFCPTVPHSTGDLELGDVTSSVGSSFLVQIKCSAGVANFANATVNISYDSAVLEFIAIVPGNDSANVFNGSLFGSPLFSLTTGSGTLALGEVNGSDCTTPGTLCYVQLNVKAGAANPTRTALAITSSSFTRADTSSVGGYSTGNGVVDVGDCAGGGGGGMPVVIPDIGFAGFVNSQKCLIAFIDDKHAIRFSRSRSDGDAFTLDQSEG